MYLPEECLLYNYLLEYIEADYILDYPSSRTVGTDIEPILDIGRSR
jgi:hypothetical protein